MWYKELGRAQLCKHTLVMFKCHSLVNLQVWETSLSFQCRFLGEIEGMFLRENFPQFLYSLQQIIHVDTTPCLSSSKFYRGKHNNARVWYIFIKLWVKVNSSLGFPLFGATKWMSPPDFHLSISMCQKCTISHYIINDKKTSEKNGTYLLQYPSKFHLMYLQVPDDFSWESLRITLKISVLSPVNPPKSLWILQGISGKSLRNPHLQFPRGFLFHLPPNTNLYVDSSPPSIHHPRGFPCSARVLVHFLVTQTHSMINRAWIRIGFLTGGRWAGLSKRQGMGGGIQEAG